MRVTLPNIDQGPFASLLGPILRLVLPLHLSVLVFYSFALPYVGPTQSIFSSLARQLVQGCLKYLEPARP